MTTTTVSGGVRRDEFPTIREQDLAIVLGDWVRLKAKQPVPTVPGEIDALDLTMIVGELAGGLHSHSLAVIYSAVPETERWTFLRERLRSMLEIKQGDEIEFASYPDRSLPVF
jgi:hypothetical protein